MKSAQHPKTRTYTAADHTFVIPAYGESPYLEDCIRSLKAQELPTNILIATSTPCDHIIRLAERYQIPVRVRPLSVREDTRVHGTGIADDWNFAFAQAQTRLVTLAHQDDVYHKAFSGEIIALLNRATHPLIAFTDYDELRAGKQVRTNRLLKVKRILLFPLRFQFFWSSVFIRRRSLSLGSAICCPSVTYVREHLPRRLFTRGYRSNIDWQVWEKLSRHRGDFVFCNKILMSHRIHTDSATTAIIADHDRSREDLEMLRRFWPAPVAGLLAMLYRNGERQNMLS